MVMLTNLADILRGAGLPVVEVNGWKTRSNDGNAFVGVRSIICHWTATPAHIGGDYPSLNIVTNGRSDLPGALAQLGLGRNGTWYTFAAGVAWHAGVVDTVAHDNYHAIGIEAEYHPDQGAWPDVQQRSYERGCAALAKAFGAPVSEIQGHYEVARPLGRKTDPNTLPGGMPGFRQRVSALINGQQQKQEDDDVPRIITGEWPAGANARHVLTFPTTDGAFFGLATGWKDAQVHAVWFVAKGKRYLAALPAFTLRADDRWWREIPKDTDQISIQLTAENPVAYSVELG